MGYVVTGYWDAGYDTSDSQTTLTSALQSINPGAIIELFEIELNVSQHGFDDTYYFHAGVNEVLTDIIWNGQAYQPLPVQAEGFEYSGNGQLPRPKLRAANVLGTITTILSLLPNGLEGAKVTRIRTLRRFLDAENFAPSDVLLLEDGFDLLYEDSSRIFLEPTNTDADPYAEWPRDIYYVDRKSAETRDVVEFELASAFDLAGVRAPKRQCVTRCQWVYRSPECSYAGTNFFDVNNEPVLNASEDVCGKKVSSCEVRFGANAELPYGGYPGIGTFFA